MQRKQSLGKPDQKDLNENLAATQGLAHMIAECKKLFQVGRWKVLLFVDAAAAKSLQTCPTLCNPIDGSPPGSPVPGILQARTLE